MYRKISTGLEWLRSPYSFLDKALARGDISFTMQLPVMGRSLVTGDPALIGQIVKDRNLIGGRGTRALRPAVGEDSLIVLEGRDHEQRRNIMLPHFFSGEMKRYDALTRKWTAHAVSQLPTGATFSGMEFVAEITLNIIIEVMFGRLPTNRHEEGRGLVKQWLRSFTNPAILFLKPLQINLGSRSPWGRFLSNRHALHDFIRSLLREPPSSVAIRGGVLASLQLSRDRGEFDCTDDELISQAVTFLLFGHDTSAAAMGWFFYHAWQDPDVLRRISGETAAKAGTAESGWADPEELGLLRSAVQESMRLSPVVVHLTRHAVSATQVGPFSVAAGERVLPCMYLAHRNPEVFDRPFQYVADRFLASNPEWRYAYFPFGLGNRMCAGMPFATRQMVLIASELITACRLELVDVPVKAVRSMVLIVPSGGPRMRRVA
jgi:cytochrome P450